jgi:cytochrome c2
MKVLRIVLAGLLVTACNKPGQPADGAASTQQPGPMGTSVGQSNAALSPQDRRLLTAATIALPPDGVAPESLPDPNSQGAHVLARFCTQCHALPSPAMHGAVDWPSVARRMWVRIDMMHGELGVQTPQEGDRTQLLNYLTSHALKVADRLPAGAGRETFQTVCSRCHQLPDPRSHASADWPGVIMRMERNMERMKVPGVTHDQSQTIIGYLRTTSRR